MPSADEIIISTAEADFEEGLAHARQSIRKEHGMIVGMTLDGVLMGAVNALRVRAQMREDARVLVDLAHQVGAGADPSVLAKEHLARVLRLKSKMHLIAREEHADFQTIMALAEGLFAKRLPDLARMVAVKDPVDFDDLARKAFPVRAEVDAMVEENARVVAQIVDHLEKHPHLLHMPRALAPKVAAMARDMIAWKVESVKRSVERIYAS